MKGIMKDFLLFISGIFVILIIISTIFGRGIAYNILGFVANAEPLYLQEELMTLLTEASQIPYEFETKIRIDYERTITIDDYPYPTVLVEAPPQFSFSNMDLEPSPFLTDCEIDKICTKTCGFIGERCTNHSDCCTSLRCNLEKLKCESINCGDGIIDTIEECDPGDDNEIPPSDSECLGECEDCVCRTITSNEGEICTSDNDCIRLMECVSKVVFDDLGGFLIIKKYFENDVCKLRIVGTK